MSECWLLLLLSFAATVYSYCVHFSNVGDRPPFLVWWPNLGGNVFKQTPPFLLPPNSSVVDISRESSSAACVRQSDIGLQWGVAYRSRSIEAACRAVGIKNSLPCRTRVCRPTVSDKTTVRRTSRAFIAFVITIRHRCRQYYWSSLGASTYEYKWGDKSNLPTLVGMGNMTVVLNGSGERQTGTAVA